MPSKKGHSLLEVIVASGIFVLIAVALAGIWVMYGKALAKSSEVVAANAVARSVTEGLAANGWDWIKDQEDETFPVQMAPFSVQRVVRGRKADIVYHISYTLDYNVGDVLFAPVPQRPPDTGPPVRFSPDICMITVTVQWNSAGGGTSTDNPDFNSQSVYSAYVYRHGI